MEQKEEKTILTPGLGAWVLSTVTGVVAPLFLQDIVAESVSNLTTGDTLNFGLILAVIMFLYFLSFSFVIFLLVVSKKVHIVLSLTLLLFGPAFIWFMLPYFLS